MHRGGIRERLDRVVANEAWKNRFVDGVLQNLDYGRSDHRPILMCIDEVAQQEFNGPSILRFQAKWLKEPNFQQVVEEAWARSGERAGSDDLAGKLDIVHELLHKWNHTTLQSTSKKLKTAQKKFETVVSGPISDESVKCQKELAAEIEFLLELEEIS